MHNLNLVDCYKRPNFFQWITNILKVWSQKKWRREMKRSLSLVHNVHVLHTSECIVDTVTRLETTLWILQGHRIEDKWIILIILLHSSTKGSITWWCIYQVRAEEPLPLFSHLFAGKLRSKDNHCMDHCKVNQTYFGCYYMDISG